MKNLLFLFVLSFLFADMQTLSFKQLTSLVADDLHKNIYLDKDIPDYSVQINFVDHQKPGQLYEFYKVVLFGHDLIMKYNRRGDFYYVSPLSKHKDNVLPPKPRPSDQDRLHFYTYRIKHITNKDVVNALSIFPDLKYKYLPQSDMIAFSCTSDQYPEVLRVLRSSDNFVKSRSVRITIFTLDSNHLYQIGTLLDKFGLSFIFDGKDFLSNPFSFHNSFEASLFLSFLQNNDFTQLHHTPTILLTNGVRTSLDSVLNVRYLQSTAEVDNQNNNTVRQSYVYKDVGLKIKILPKIKDDWVFMYFSLISEDIISFSEDNPTTSKIAYQSSFKVRKGHPLLLTGIYKTLLKKRSSSIPVVSRVPFFGSFFSGSKNDDRSSVINILIEVL